MSLKKFLAIASWCLYDWGISAFPVIITTFVIATYFTSKIAPTVITGTNAWGMAMAVAGIITAIASPILGAIANKAGKIKVWLGFFTCLTIISAAFLWFAYPNQHSFYYTLAWVAIGTISLNVCMVFYNALLAHLISDHFVGRVSGWGWGLGYLGGLAILLIAFYGLINHHPVWLSTTDAAIRFCGPLVAIWVFVFAIPLFLFVPEKTAEQPLALRQAVYCGIKSLYHTLKNLRQQKNIFIFLLAQMIYIDGLNTLFAFGGIYAAGTFHFTMGEVLIFGITMNMFAGVGSILFAWVDDWLGAKTTIIISLAGLILFGAGLVLTTHIYLFWILASLLSLFVGPVQSASRSLMTHLIPPKKATEFFGLYILSGKMTTFLGPWLLGTMTLYFNSQRIGMSSVLIFFAIGGLVLLKGVRA